MKRAALFCFASSFLVGGCVLGWWAHDYMCSHDVREVADFYASDVHFTARALWQTNQELEARLLNVHLSSDRFAHPYCSIIPVGAGEMAIDFYSGVPGVGFPDKLRKELSAFAIKRVADITTEDRNGHSEPLGHLE